VTYSAGIATVLVTTSTINVVFNTPMPNTNYAVTLTDNTPTGTFTTGAPVFVATNQATTGFTLAIRTAAGTANPTTAPAGGLQVEWIAIEDQ
jgi:hypothetical protein